MTPLKTPEVLGEEIAAKILGYWPPFKFSDAGRQIQEAIQSERSRCEELEKEINRITKLHADLAVEIARQGNSEAEKLKADRQELLSGIMVSVHGLNQIKSIREASSDEYRICVDWQLLDSIITTLNKLVKTK